MSGLGIKMCETVETLKKLVKGLALSSCFRSCSEFCTTRIAIQKENCDPRRLNLLFVLCNDL